MWWWLLKKNGHMTTFGERQGCLKSHLDLVRVAERPSDQDKDGHNNRPGVAAMQSQPSPPTKGDHMSHDHSNFF